MLIDTQYGVISMLLSDNANTHGKCSCRQIVYIDVGYNCCNILLLKTVY